MPYADINGQRIRFEDSGGDGPPVILSHGFLMDREMFAPQVEALSPEFRVITWDERGFGETEFDGEPFTYWDSAKDCLAPARPPRDRARPSSAACRRAGFSRCGRRCSRPSACGRLVLIDTQAGVEDPERLPAYRQMQETWLRPARSTSSPRRSPTLIIGDPVAQRALDPEVARASPRGDGRARRRCSTGTTSPTASARSPARRSCSTERPTRRSRWTRRRSCPRRFRTAAGCQHRRRAACVEPDPSRAGQRAAARVSARDLGRVRDTRLDRRRTRSRCPQPSWMRSDTSCIRSRVTAAVTSRPGSKRRASGATSGERGVPCGEGGPGSSERGSSSCANRSGALM